MTEPPMVERAARAMCRVDCKIAMRHCQPDEPCIDWRDFTGMARAAIATMRVPTEEMRSKWEGEWGDYLDICMDAWDTGITIALLAPAGVAER